MAKIGWRTKSSAAILLAGALLFGFSRSTAETAQQQQADALIAAGNRLDDSGDHLGAIADYNQAMGLGEDFTVRMERAVAYGNAGNYSAAFADLGQAQQMQPRNSAVYSERYWLQFELYQFPAVLGSIAAEQGFAPPDEYAPLIRFIASGRLGKSDAAALARTVTANSGNLWPAAAALMLLGRTSPETLLAQVADSANQQAACEAPFYAGEYYLLRHRRDLAAAAFAANQVPGCRWVTEYRAARSELEALGGAVQ